MDCLTSSDAGERAVRFISNLTHTGDYAGQPFSPRPWQRAIVERLFGTLQKDGTRQYRSAFLGMPRKQGKTELAAAMLLYLLLGSGRKGQHIYSASGDRAQASLIYRAAASMVRNDAMLSKLCLTYDGYKKIICEQNDSFYEALSSDAPRKHGLGPSAVLFDEVHVLPDRALHDALTTGFAARREPLTIYVTTAGWDRHSLCYELWDHALKVRDGIVQDPTFLPILFAAEPDDDWESEQTWRKAMPALGDFCSIEFVRNEYAKVKNGILDENAFRQLYLNQWTEQKVRWMSMDRWNACRVDVSLPEFVGQECFCGLDLSQTRDLTSFSAVFPGMDGYTVFTKSWAPQDGRWRNEQRTAELYRRWERDGFLEFMPGESIEYDYIEHAIAQFAQDFVIKKVFADRAFANQLCTRLRDVHGIEVEFIPQTALRLNEPTLAFERFVLAKKLRQNDPVLTWAVSNAAARTGPTGLVQLDKAKSTGRIDPLMATIFALAACSEAPSDTGFVYAERGMLFI